MSQIALPLQSARKGDVAKIVLGNANRGAADALAEPGGWPFRTAVLVGPPRSGKTLLGLWFAASGKGETLDGADRWDETELFHRWNRAQENGKPLLLISDADSWDIALPDLRSRLGGSLQLEIGVPDDDMVGDLIEAHAEQRGLMLGEGARGYLVPRIERSFAAIERVVAEIDRISLERQAPATMSVWRDALEAVQGPEQGRLL
ncbi:MAG: HdaA/DnaA family protein [Qipengyuania sp.]